MELVAGKLISARLAGDRSLICAACDRGADRFRRLVSRANQDISAGLSVFAVFVVGGSEVRSANRDDAIVLMAGVAVGVQQNMASVQSTRMYRSCF